MCYYNVEFYFYEKSTLNINDELNNNQQQELEKWFPEQIYKLNKINKNEQLNYCTLCSQKTSKLRIQTKKFENNYYNNFNSATGKYSNPEVSTEQMNLIDTAIQELKYKSK